MKISVPVSGYCPTQGCEYTINVDYEVYGTPAKGVQVGAVCDYITYNKSLCPNFLQCPIRASAPKTSTL